MGIKTKKCLLIGTVIFAQCSIFMLSRTSLQHLVVGENYITNADNVFSSSYHDRSASHPWPDDPECRHFTVQLAERDSLPKWPLTSFPGSGVTFARQLIEGVTVIYTGSVYDSDPLPVLLQNGNNASFVDDPRCGCTIIDKDHEATLFNFGLPHYFQLLHYEALGGLLRTQYDGRGILLLRNPMDVVFTFRHWSLAGKTGQAPLDAFYGDQWDEVVDTVAYVWADHAIRWIDGIENGTVIFYEKLLGPKAAIELERMLNAMDFGPINPDRMQCALAHRNRLDHKRTNKPKLALEPKHRLKLLKAINKVQQRLHRKKWPTMPVYLYNLHVDSAARI